MPSVRFAAGSASPTPGVCATTPIASGSRKRISNSWRPGTTGSASLPSRGRTLSDWPSRETFVTSASPGSVIRCSPPWLARIVSESTLSDARCAALSHKGRALDRARRAFGRLRLRDAQRELLARQRMEFECAEVAGIDAGASRDRHAFGVDVPDWACGHAPDFGALAERRCGQRERIALVERALPVRRAAVFADRSDHVIALDLDAAGRHVLARERRYVDP